VRTGGGTVVGGIGAGLVVAHAAKAAGTRPGNLTPQDLMARDRQVGRFNATHSDSHGKAKV